MGAFLRLAFQALLFAASHSLVSGAFIPFENCLPDSTLNSDPLLLQWVPQYVDVRFDTESPNNLNVTLYGNVTGQQVEGQYPPPSDPQWDMPNNTFGKISDEGSARKLSTLLAGFEVLTYDAYEAKGSRFCDHIINGSCPLGPLFSANASNPYELHTFSLAHDFGSPYQFSTLAATIRVISGDVNAPTVACVSTNITPDLGPSITGLLTWLPAVILIIKAIATLTAAIWSPWGSSDIFRWSSNYGRDEDLLRLVTPGFGDCLQYIQFVTLMGSLTLQYPGFFQPAVSQTAWSLLLFNQSFVSGGNGTQSLQDGIYVTSGQYGIATMRQLVGIDASYDVWACMAVFLAAIAGGIIVLCQLGFFLRWVYRKLSGTSEEDLRRKNIPFTFGNMVRLLFNFFILPIVAFSLFQLVISNLSPTSVIAVAAILLVVVVLTAAWILYIIFKTRPRTHLFDDMPTVLAYGPLYNTYSDSAAPFALIPVLITFMRGVAFGAVQPNGTAQIIILAICEVILILTLNGFRPFQNQTSMNAYHTFFSVVRLVTIMLSVAFVGSLGVSEASKGWIGYTILLLHACVLVFGFFLNSAQTLIEVAVRSLGLAGSDAQSGAVRGNILGWRMLKKRQDRSAAAERASMSSDAAILRDSRGDDGRARSMSASSQQLLGQGRMTPTNPRISGFDNFSNGGDGVGSPDPDLGYMAVAQGASPHKPSIAVKTDGEAFYRPPRRKTIDALTPGAQSRSVVEPEFAYSDAVARSASTRDSALKAEGNGSPVPAYIRDRADSDPQGQANRPDYAVREVDQYYHGTALSNNPARPTRKLKTGPANPESPAASASTWFQRFVFGVKEKAKQKDSGKGFEVVRSKPMMWDAPKGEAEGEGVEMQTSPPMNAEPYRDSPEMQQGGLQAAAGAERSVSPLEDNAAPVRPSRESAVSAMRQNMHPGMRAEYPARDPSVSATSRGRPSVDQRSASNAGTHTDYRPSSEFDGEEPERFTRISEVPTLGPIESVGGMDIPSRFNSRRSANLDSDRGWLSDVDNISWPHAHAEPQGLNYSTSSRTPTVPERSAERERSSSNHHNPHGRRESNLQSYEDPSGFLVLGGGNDDDDYADEGRPNSFFNSHHHRAADSIHRNSFGARAGMQASSAEIYGGDEEQGWGRDVTGRFR
ncbi:uncharacterized protein LTR77_008802 [Saxophila tyrrhenica]|uniref:ML-like domain-containing protein n=1 Tax=Saxophila tyrrhenica TaxID=1690608 RepID=A0AAV9P0X3_9PEZI|nr:hypothetical protein LTR77_008802 [Saxophila tyrrhenica]